MKRAKGLARARGLEPRPGDAAILDDARRESMLCAAAAEGDDDEKERER